MTAARLTTPYPSKAAFFKEPEIKLEKMPGGNGPAKLYKFVTPKGVFVSKEFKMTPDSIYPELFITPNVKHPNILSAKLVVKDKNTQCLVMPYFGIGTLGSLESELVCESNQHLRYYILHQIFNAMIYLAENNIYHHDLHADNILIDENARIKIIDFGIADHIDSSKPVFGKFIYPPDDEFSSKKKDSYIIAQTVIAVWSYQLPDDKFLTKACKIRNMNLDEIKKLNQELKDILPDVSKIRLPNKEKAIRASL